MGNYLHATTMPESGVILEPCCSLMVTVPSDGLDHVIVVGSPAVTSRVLPWTLMALFWAAAKAANTERMGIVKRMVYVVGTDVMVQSLL